MTTKKKFKNPHIAALKKRSKKFEDRRKRRSKEKEDLLADEAVVKFQGVHYLLG
jgi:hypothetical protein